MEDTNKDNSVFELTKKLIDLECNRAKVEAAIYSKKCSRIVANKVKDLTECILENAKEYGQKIEYDIETGKIKSANEAKIIRDFTLNLESIGREHGKKYTLLLKEKLEIQQKNENLAIELDYVARQRDIEKQKPEYMLEKSLQNEAKIAIENGEYIKAENINKSLQETSKKNNGVKYEKLANKINAEQAVNSEILKQLEEELNKCSIELKQIIDIIMGKKDNLLQKDNSKSLMVIQNKNIIQRAMDKILNKFNGNKRYTENVRNVLEKKARDMKEVAIPALKDKIQKGTEKAIEQIKKETIEFIYDEVEEKEEEKEKIDIPEFAINGAKKVQTGLKYVAYQGMNMLSEKNKQRVENVWNMSRQTCNAMIEECRSARMWAKTKMEERISALKSIENNKKEEKAMEENEKSEEIER